MFKISFKSLHKMSQTAVNTKPNDFKHIIRILNTNVDGKRQVPFGLTAIKGCGRRFGMLICKRARIPLTMRCGSLDEDHVTAIQAIMEHPLDHGFPVWMLNRRRDIKEGKNVHLASTGLDSYIREDVERMKKMKLPLCS
jgi:small subunit ribosomal protein S18e